MAEQITDSSRGLESPALAKVNILVVDDRPDGLLALEAVLCSDNYNIFKAGSGQEAVRYTMFHDFAVILLDVQMPEMDGFETARMLRENFRSRDTPIIFVTAINKEIVHINQGYENGAVDYIFKPFDPFILKSKINIFVDLFEKNMQIRRQADLLRRLEAQEKARQISQLRQESLRSYSHLADAVPHCIIKVLPSGQVEYYNQRWVEYTGFKSNTDWKSVVHSGDAGIFLRLWSGMRRHDARVFSVEMRLRSAKDGLYRWHLVRVVPEIMDGKTISWIASCTDIDDIKHAEEALKTQSVELNRSNKELEEYAYVASHDLKEPLHVVSSFVYLLEKRFEGKLEDREKGYLKCIREAVNQAQTLIKDLLEYSCVGKDKSMKLVDLSSVLKEVQCNLNTTIQKEGAVIRCGTMPEIMANPSEMVQLFQNVIGNAIKYRGIKPLEIDIASRLDGNKWVFSVKDNGIGLDPQFKERIFNMFQRLHPKSEYSGSGIGLAICKKIVEKHGGRIWVDSKPAQGATFYFAIRRHA
jgi:PAS domain S-box-containing protein